jgi:glycosyltransferase involved in cell wall biosynthesis
MYITDVKPVLNITMPVFNRYEYTHKAIFALRKCSRKIPFTLTVVDNGSDSHLVKRLVELKEAQIIDKLFLLKKNMGVSCAVNIGWEMTDAQFYMKLDNDCVIHEQNFIEKLFKLWRHGEELSTLGGAYNKNMLLKNPGSLHTEDGILGICTTNLPGHAIIIQKAVSDILGFWSEDYGLYGAEDGDYGLRMECAGLKQYYYYAPEFLVHLGTNDNEEIYLLRGIDKKKELHSVFFNEMSEDGLFKINNTLYNLCIRSWKPVRKYKVIDIDKKYQVRLCENKEYEIYRTSLDLCIKKSIHVLKKYQIQINYIQMTLFRN